MEITKKMAILMAGLGYKAKHIIDITGFSPTKVSKILNGIQQPTGRDLFTLAKALRVDQAYLQNEDDGDPTRYIPIVGSASCGIPDGIIEHNGEFKSIPSEIFTMTAYAVSADGDSMSPTIDNGDMVICDSKQIAENDIIHYVINSTGESGIKRYHTTNGTVMLIADNSAYKPIVISNDDTITANRVMAVSKPIKKL